MFGLSKHLVRQWVFTWGLLGVVSGLGLILGDTGHLPASWLVIVVTIGAVVAGLIAVIGFALLVYLLPSGLGRNPVGRTGVGAIAGAASALLLGWFVLGVEWRHALVWGAFAGVISVLVGLRLQIRAKGN